MRKRKIITVYRVQKVDGTGPYRGFEVPWHGRGANVLTYDEDKKTGRHNHNFCYCHLGAQRDGLRTRSSKRFFGFPTLGSAQKWFSGWEPELANLEYFIFEFRTIARTVEVGISGKQLTFIPIPKELPTVVFNFQSQQTGA